MFLFNKNGYLKSGIPEEVVKEIVRKYAEQEEAKKISENYLRNEPRSMQDIATARNPEIGMMVANLEGVKKLGLTTQAHSCIYCAVATPTEEEQVANLLSMVDLGEEDKTCSTPAPTQKQHHANGMTCRRCNVLNKYITESNQTDGTYLCWGCKAGF